MRTIPHFLIGAACLFTSYIGSTAIAQTASWPNKPITVLVATPAGNAPDLVARIFSERLTQLLGQPVIVDNRPGANGIVAVKALTSAPSDGHTLALLHSSVTVVTPFTYKAAGYDPDKDFEAVAMAGRTPMLFVVNAAHSAKTFSEFIKLAKEKPEQVSLGNPTRTSVPHLAAELVGQKAVVKFQHVPFANSAQGIQGVISGDIDMYVDAVGPLVQLVKRGQLRALAVTSDVELPGLEGIPLAMKTVPELSVSGWFMLHAPKGTPLPILQRLNNEMNKVMQEASTAARLRGFGIYPTPGSLGMS